MKPKHSPYTTIWPDFATFVYNMKKLLLLIIVVAVASPLFAQKVDSIYFNLYTDSLKKGQHNYINVDGKMSNGRWMPLTSKDIQFSCSVAAFDGNELIIPVDFKENKVTVKAVLKNNPSVWKERTIWIKKMPDGELPTREEIMNGTAPRKNRNKNR
jgi:hypothetical protein